MGIILTHARTIPLGQMIVSSTFKLTFTLFNKFGFCESAQEGGYITFNAQIDIAKPLFLTVRRENANEQLYFHYFKVELCSVLFGLHDGQTR